MVHEFIHFYLSGQSKVTQRANKSSLRYRGRCTWLDVKKLESHLKYVVTYNWLEYRIGPPTHFYT